MADENPEIRIPEDEQAVVDMLDDDASEQEENVAIAQARLIGDM
jgi:hypothetical protein